MILEKHFNCIPDKAFLLNASTPNIDLFDVPAETEYSVEGMPDPAMIKTPHTLVTFTNSQLPIETLAQNIQERIKLPCTPVSTKEGGGVLISTPVAQVITHISAIQNSTVNKVNIAITN